MTKTEILEHFALFDLGTDGIGSWLSERTDSRVFDRLARLDSEPLAKVQLNQLLSLGHEAPVSDDFFRYYWLSAPRHPYDVTKTPDYSARWVDATAILSLTHLRWGFCRLFTDGLLYSGNVRTAFRRLRALTTSELQTFFMRRRFDTEAIRARGPSLPLTPISRDDRYLISEMACKSYGTDALRASALKDALLSAWKVHAGRGGGRTTIRQLLDSQFLAEEHRARQQEFIFSSDDVLDESVGSEAEIEQRYSTIADRFVKASV